MLILTSITKKYVSCKMNVDPENMFYHSSILCVKRNKVKNSYTSLMQIKLYIIYVCFNFFLNIEHLYVVLEIYIFKTFIYPPTHI